MKLSLIIPTLHRPQSVDRLLASLLSQAFDLQQLEVIVVMNLPDADQAARITSWVPKLNIRGITTGIAHINKARNAGIENAQGEILLILDDDMELSQPDVLQNHLKYHQDSALSALGGGCAMPAGASLVALAYHIIGLAWMRRYRRADGTTPFLLGGHASYKRRIFDGGARFDNEIVFGGSETGFNLNLFHRGEKLLYATEIRPIHHNDVKLRNFVRKAYLQGFNGALRKESVARPKAQIKHEIAIVEVTNEERIPRWKERCLKFYFWAYEFAADAGRRAALEDGGGWRGRLVRWWGRVH